MQTRPAFRLDDEMSQPDRARERLSRGDRVPHPQHLARQSTPIRRSGRRETPLLRERDALVPGSPITS